MDGSDRMTPAEQLGLVPPGARRRGRRRLVLWLGVAGLALLAGVWALQPGSGGPAIRYTTEPATRGPLTVTVTATGTVEPTRVVSVSSELSGQVASVAVDFNDPVKAGQVLAVLDTDRLEAEVTRSRAALAAKRAGLSQAEATLREATADLARTEPLAAKGSATAVSLATARAALDRATAAREVALAEISVAEADLLMDETSLTKSCICSPIDGVVLSRAVDPGMTVASTLQAPVLFTLAEDLHAMQLEVDIDEADVGAVREGQTARFTVEAWPDRDFPATLVELRYSPTTQEGVVTYTAVLTLRNDDMALRPGMTATAEIVVAELPDALTIPNAALRYAPPSAPVADTRSFLQRMMPGPPRATKTAAPEAEPDGLQSVWVLRGTTPEAVSLRPGQTDGRRTVVPDGALAPGDLLITDQSAGE